MDISSSDLVGRGFSASIGEPWNFASSVGENHISGQILCVVESPNGHPVLLCSVSSFKDDLLVVSRIAAVNRYSYRDQDVLAMLRSGQAAVMNFVYSKAAEPLTGRNALAVLASPAATKFLVGSMTLSA